MFLILGIYWFAHARVCAIARVVLHFGEIQLQTRASANDSAETVEKCSKNARLIKKKKKKKKKYVECTKNVITRLEFWADSYFLKGTIENVGLGRELVLQIYCREHCNTLKFFFLCFFALSKFCGILYFNPSRRDVTSDMTKLLHFSLLTWLRFVKWINE